METMVVVVVGGQDLWPMINGFWILYPWPQRPTGSGEPLSGM